MPAREPRVQQRDTGACGGAIGLGGMDENELRRKALESMMKKKGGPPGAGAGKEDGEVEEEGAGGGGGAAAAKKSKWADDEDQEASPPDGPPPLPPPCPPACCGCVLLLHLPPRPPDCPSGSRLARAAKRAKVAEQVKLSPSRQPTPTDTPAAAAPTAAAHPSPAERPPSKSKWAEDEDEEKPPLAANAEPAKSVPAAAKPPAGAKKSKWAEDSEEEEEDAATETASAKADQNADLVSEARGVGDAASALDLLEDRLGKRVMGHVSADREAGGEEGEGKGDDAAKDEDGLEPAEPVEPYDATTENLQLHRCREVDKAYQKLNKIDEGTYGVVYRAKCRKTEKIVALKQVKLERAREGFPLTALRELTVLLALRHVNIVHVIEVVVSPKKQVFMAMEYMEHDFRALMESMKTPFRTPHVKCLMKQLLAGVEFMHRHWVIHRDLKTSNLLLDNRGQLKVCDFGLARKYRDPIAAMTQEVVTLWYRAPELLYGEKKYDTKIDMWSVGCIFAELLLHKPLMQGKSEQDQRDKICELLGSPDEDNWPKFNELPGAKHVRYKKKQSVLREKIPLYSYTGDPTLSDKGFELLKGLLSYSPERRFSASQSLADKIGYFDEAPRECKPEHMPTYPSTHELPKGHKKRARSRKMCAKVSAAADRRHGP